MALPPELIDEILFRLRYDKRTLQECSLVAKSWVYRCQKLLHDWHLRFTPETYKTWRETASPARVKSLQHVRSMTCSGFNSLRDVHGEHLQSLHRLQHITLDNVKSAQRDLINLLPASQGTISSLHLSRVSIYDTGIVRLINYFPNLREFDIDQSKILKDPLSIPPSSRSPRGKLGLADLRKQDMAALSACLARLEPAYDELEIVNTYGLSYPDLPPIIYACGKALARLVLDPAYALSDLTLENCSGLRELMFTANPTGPRSTELRLIGSITSTNMQKIVFAVWDGRWNPTYWLPLDRALSNLVDRLRASGYEHTLELEFRLKPGFPAVYPTVGLDVWFPRFEEKGRVTVLDPESGRTFYRSEDFE